MQLVIKIYWVSAVCCGLESSLEV